MKKVIIIGAGPAGITAGYELLKQSDEYEVTILEESSNVGGISRTEVYNGHRMDIGGHRFFSKSQEVNDWWEKIMPMQGAPAYDDDKLGRSVPLAQGGPDPAKEDRVMLNRSRISHIYYKRKFFEYPVRMNMDTIKNMGFGTTMQAGFSYLGSMVAKKPVNSLENFYINQFGKKLYSMFFEGYTEKLWGRHPRDIDPSWGAQRTKGLSITEIVKDATRKAFHKEAKEVNTSLIGAFKYPKLGPGQLWEAAAADFEEMGGSIHLNCRVIRINTDGNRVESVTCAVDGITIEEKADIVISSMPIKDLIVGMSNVPPNVTEVARKLPYRDFVTVGLLVPKLRINNTTYMKTLGNVIPDTWIYVQDTGVKMGRIQIFNNWSPYLLENPEKTVWVGLEYFCNEGDRYWNMTDEEWVQFATKELVQMGILSESTKVLDAHKVAVKKAYPAYFDSYSRFDEVRTFLDGFDNLYCVGRNGQHRYNNMDHSMITSFETVKNIISGQKDKSNIWNVNTEQEYHEEKNNKKVEDNEVVKEEKVMTTAAPVPPVKEMPKAAEEASVVAPPAVNSAPAKQEIKTQPEEELQATVQQVPAPPVRKQLRRNPVPKNVVEDTASQELTGTQATAVAESVSAVAVPVTSSQIVEENTMPEVNQDAEIHVSKSRSIWDDVAYAEAISEVKTAPIRFKSVEEAHAAVKGSATEEKAEEKKPAKTGRKKKVVEAEATDTTQKEEVKSQEVTEAKVEETKAEEVTEVKPEAKKPTRSRRKKAVEAAPEVLAEETQAEAVAEVKKEEAKVEETKTEEIAEVKPEAKKPTRSRRKKPVETTPEVSTEVAKPEEVAEMKPEEAKPEEVAEVKPEETKTEEVSEVKPEEAKTEEVAEVKPEVKKPTRSRRKKPVETVPEVAAEEVKTEPLAEVKAEEITHSRSTSGKTIAGRSASHRSASNRQTSGRRKSESANKNVSNIGKEAVVGNMKGTVIKANVIQKTSEMNKKNSSERSGRK